jgi:hypothetical protein
MQHVIAIGPYPLHVHQPPMMEAIAMDNVVVLQPVIVHGLLPVLVLPLQMTVLTAGRAVVALPPLVIALGPPPLHAPKQPMMVLRALINAAHRAIALGLRPLLAQKL